MGPPINRGRTGSMTGRSLDFSVCGAYNPINSRHICATVDGNNMVVLPRVISDRRRDVAYDGNCGYHSVIYAIQSDADIIAHLRPAVRAFDIGTLMH